MNADVWHSSLVPAAHVVSRRLDETFFLVNLENNAVFELNATGSEIWSWIDEKHSLSGCIEDLLAKFDVDPAVLRQEVEALVTGLVLEGLIETPREACLSETNR